MSGQETRKAIDARKHLRSEVSLRIRQYAKKNADLPDH